MKKNIRKNRKGNWFGYEGRRCVKNFSTSEIDARHWLEAEMSAEEKEKCDAINAFGDGQHPVADADSLPYFVSAYVEKCLRRFREWKKKQAARAKYNEEHREPQAHGDDGEDYAPLPKRERTMHDWQCPKCGHEVLAVEKPEPIKWTDGHVCHFTMKGE